MVEGQQGTKTQAAASMDLPETGGPDPEQTALQWALAEGEITHTRLNYWLVTEGVLLAAFAAAANAALGESVWWVRLVLSFSGIFFTATWHSIYIRGWAWFDWWFHRLQTIHFQRWGTPIDKDTGPPWGVIMPPKFLGFRKGGGLSSKSASFLLMFAFGAIWSLFLGLCWVSLWNTSQESLAGLGVTILVIWIAYAILVLLYLGGKQ